MHQQHVRRVGHGASQRVGGEAERTVAEADLGADCQRVALRRERVADDAVQRRHGRVASRGGDLGERGRRADHGEPTVEQPGHGEGYPTDRAVDDARDAARPLRATERPRNRRVRRLHHVGHADDGAGGEAGGAAEVGERERHGRGGAPVHGPRPSGLRQDQEGFVVSAGAGRPRPGCEPSMASASRRISSAERRRLGSPSAVAIRSMNADAASYWPPST